MLSNIEEDREWIFNIEPRSNHEDDIRARTPGFKHPHHVNERPLSFDKFNMRQQMDRAWNDLLAINGLWTVGYRI
ncbi:hypothetical protein TNCV_4414571 [Trichonephila clavipes]|uniref:Uncharacterized protein n=1 Tax=Trichonephila clavipes TaxID=2585209 RepID=A0A8X6V9I4_TRICX|nr:hypothetical protein TNCV_4414571 [Trichonephila clavipes]